MTPSSDTAHTRNPVSARLPAFTWDATARLTTLARGSGRRVVDLSMGTPIDPTPDVVRRGLAGAADAPGYPRTAGSAAVREAVCGWFARTQGVPGLDPANVLPTVGSKELVGWLPTLLGLGPDDAVAVPALAYPTYDVGARMAGAATVPYVEPTDVDPGTVRLLWLNSPANPHGRVLEPAAMAEAVDWARAHDVLVASDECYLEFGWESTPRSVLHPSVCGDSHVGVLAVGSLSKRSNMAGYRAGHLAGDPAVVAELLEVRKQVGMIVPAPVQAAMVAALGDDAHVEQQRERYRRRRDRLRAGFAAAGWRLDHSEGGLYLWVAVPDGDGFTAAERLARRGVVVVPGEMYGDGGRGHVRVALTVADDLLDDAVERIGAVGNPGG